MSSACAAGGGSNDQWVSLDACKRRWILSVWFGGTVLIFLGLFGSVIGWGNYTIGSERTKNQEYREKISEHLGKTQAEAESVATSLGDIKREQAAQRVILQKLLEK